MTMLKSVFLTAAAVISEITVRATAQAPSPLPQPQSQSLSQQLMGGYYPQAIHGKPAYGYSDNSLGVVIGQLLGNRYSETDSMAVKQCAAAAMQQAAVKYQPQSYGNVHPYGEGYNPAALLRITAITDVKRSQNGLRVSGLIDGRFDHAPYGHAYGYQNNGYMPAGDLSFRCDIDYRGIISNLRVHSAHTYRG